MVGIKEAEAPKELAIKEEDVKMYLQDGNTLVESASALEDSTRYYLIMISKYPLLKPEEELDLAYRLREGDQSAKDKLVISNLRLVVGIAKHFSTFLNQSLSLLDLVQEGNIGLMKASEKYNPDLGYRFSTYATWWIKQAITRHLDNNQNAIRIPVHVGEGIKKIKRWAVKFASQEGREPSHLELIEALPILNVSRDQYEAYRLCSSVVSLESPIKADSGEDSELGSLIPNEDLSVDTNAMENCLHNGIVNILESQLTPKELDIIYKRFGFEGKMLTLEEIGAEYGVCRERIRQIEEKALKKLKRPHVALKFINEEGYERTYEGAFKYKKEVI